MVALLVEQLADMSAAQLVEMSALKLVELWVANWAVPKVVKLADL